MKNTRVTALAVIGIAAALSLTACDDGGSEKGSPAQGSSSSASSSQPASGDSGTAAGSDPGGSKAGGATPGSGEDAETHAGGSNSTARAGGGSTFCKTEDLAIDAVDAASDQRSGRIDITMVNRGSTTCSATGFAGVDIKDADHTSNPVPRGHAQPRVTVLKPGDAAVFDLAYDIDDSGDSLTNPTGILVTPPNETHTVSLAWPTGAGKVKGAYTDVEVYPTHTAK
ncbi:DUF4232 domain-containing protein [Streptomyces seoulensis]|nr:DUF4232 domain-containing protein [Streptomyces seoulensis]